MCDSEEVPADTTTLQETNMRGTNNFDSLDVIKGL